jgi:L-alanine-DL-glutamate epimerase-like enolase superfamily enzyme
LLLFMSLTYQYLVGGAKLTLTLENYPLKLKSTFGTSHSSTDFRLNGLCCIKINNEWIGWGECGLPPKKADVYFADFDDVKTYFVAFNQKLRSVIEQHDSATYNPFESVPAEFCHAAKTVDGPHSELIRTLFRALDECDLNKEHFSRPPRNALESAIFDLWGKLTRRPTHSLLGVPPIPKRCFYTAALNDNLDLIAEATKFGMNFTDNIKIKVNRDVTKGKAILSRLKRLFEVEECRPNYIWSIDANADWTPTIAMHYLHEVILPHNTRHQICMVEQPFPPHLKNEEMLQWKKVRDEYNKHQILIFADESIHTAEDVHRFGDIVDGVNVKLDKTGGYREALKTIHAAKQRGLQVTFPNHSLIHYNMPALGRFGLE